jgi:hypothetical protein
MGNVRPTDFRQGKTFYVAYVLPNEKIGHIETLFVRGKVERKNLFNIDYVSYVPCDCLDYVHDPLRPNYRYLDLIGVSKINFNFARTFTSKRKAVAYKNRIISGCLTPSERMMYDVFVNAQAPEFNYDEF